MILSKYLQLVWFDADQSTASEISATGRDCACFTWSGSKLVLFPLASIQCWWFKIHKFKSGIIFAWLIKLHISFEITASCSEIVTSSILGLKMYTAFERSENFVNTDLTCGIVSIVSESLLYKWPFLVYMHHLKFFHLTKNIHISLRKGTTCSEEALVEGWNYSGCASVDCIFAVIDSGCASRLKLWVTQIRFFIFLWKVCNFLIQLLLSHLTEKLEVEVVHLNRY